MMQFLHPGILGLGLLACAIPIIIHLIFRRRFQRLPWAAMKFLLAAYKKTKTSLLLEHLLLLAVRILMVMLLALMFARPIARLIPGLVPEWQTQHFIILLDNSFSMEVREANISPFEKGKKFARQLLENARENDTVTFVTMNEQPQMLLSFTSLASEERKNEILQKIEQIELSCMGSDIEATFDLLKEDVRQKEHLSNKHLYVISDFQKRPWEKAYQSANLLQTLKSLRAGLASFEFIDVGVNETANLAVVKLDVDGVVGVGILSKFVATVANLGMTPFDNVEVNFYADGNKKYSERISLKGQEQQELAFFESFDSPGSHHVTAEVTADALVTDNKRYLSFDVINKIRVLMIDGEPKEGVFEKESDYLMAALGHSPDSLIQAERVDIGTLAGQTRFKDYQVVVLANLQTFDEERRFKELEEFVAKGGGVFIWLGEKVDVQYYNDNLFKDGIGILPGKIVGSPVGKASENEEKTVFNWQGFTKHRLWNYFQASQKLMEDLKKVMVYRFFPIKIDTEDKTVTVLAHYNDPSQYPAVIERRSGSGKIILMTTTADREWNSLHSDQFGHVFLVLAHESIQYLVLAPAEEQNLRVGQTFTKSFDYLLQNIQLTLPSGKTKILGIQGATAVKTAKDTPTMAAENECRVEYRDTLKAGIYTLEFATPAQVEMAKEKTDRQYFSVNVDPAEGELVKIGKDELQSGFKDIQIQYHKDTETTKQETKASQQTEYWKLVLLLLVAAALLESFMAMWFGRHTR